MSIRRVAISTGGGDCPGLNAVIRAVVRVGCNAYRWEILGIENAYQGLVDPSRKAPHGNRWLGSDEIHGILTRGGTIIGTSNRSDPFHFVVEENGKRFEKDISRDVMTNFRALGLDAMIAIGGDGSMRIAQRFFELGMPVVGVPKTIDNDLEATDQTFGFDTAVRVATEALDRIRDTAESHDRVMLVEVMGRGAGWIALEAGLAGGADAILIPEIPYRIEPIAKMIQARRARGYRSTVVVVSEGAKPVGGGASEQPKQLGAMPRLVGAAERVSNDLAPLVGDDIRVTVLGHIQRGGSPTHVDRILGTRFGSAAAKLVFEGKFGRMVALRNGQIIDVPIADATQANKLVDPSAQLVQTARSLGVVFGDEDAP